MPDVRNSPFMLVNLSSKRNESFTFVNFPGSTSTEDQANWESQNTTIGVKPLQYANREPQRIEANDLYFDKSATNESITPDLERLRALQRETEQGVPSPLLLVVGDWQKRVVLQTVRVESDYFREDGAPLRAKISLTMVELQGGAAALPTTQAVSPYQFTPPDPRRNIRNNR